MTITGNSECFQYFNFETISLKNTNKPKKLEYRFLAESTKIEKATFTYKIALSEAPMLRQTECGVQTGPITKNRVLPVTTRFFL